MGITNYVYLSNGERIENPRFLRKSAEKLAKLQSKLADRVKGSKPWQIIKNKISRLHQFVARTRIDFKFKIAHELFSKCDVLVVEDLSIKNLTRRAKIKTDIEDNKLVYLPNGQAAKSGLNKSMLDAAHGQLIAVLKYVAWKLVDTPWQSGRRDSWIIQSICSLMLPSASRDRSVPQREFRCAPPYLN